SYPFIGSYLGAVTTRIVTTGPQSGRGTWYDFNQITSTTTTYTYPTYSAIYTSYTTNVTTTVTYYDYILDSFNYQMSDMGSSGSPAKVYVRGDAILYLTGSGNLSGITIESGKSLKLYAPAPSVVLGGNENG